MARALATRSRPWQRLGSMGGNVQKWFTGLGLTGLLVAMFMTRNSIFQARIFQALRATLAVAATFGVAGSATAGSFGTALPRQDMAAPASADPTGEAASVPGIAPSDGATLAEQMAQYSPVPPRGRPVSDHDHARETARAGENRGFDELMRSAQSRGRGEYLGVEPDISRNVYRFKFLRSGGNVVWVDVDGRTGKVLAERD
jgi:hypothetical protein